MIKAKVTATSIVLETDEKLTAGRVGLECGFEFDSAWDGLAKTAVFEGVETAAVVVKGETVVIPPEVFDNAAGYPLRIAVTGTAPDGSIVIPTVWGKAGRIENSAATDEYEESKWEPTPDLGAQVMSMAANAEAIARSVREDADSGKLVGAPGPQGEKGEKGEQGERGEDGATGKPFTYEDFTPAQLEALKVKGDKGDTGAQGERGAAFTYSDFTPAQLEALKVKGDKGDKGDKPVMTTSRSGSTVTIRADGVSIGTVNDGAKGDKGDTGTKGDKGDKGEDGLALNPNLLDNAWFTVNQRGSSSYNGQIYGLDRWKGNSAACRVIPTADGMKMTNSGSTSTATQYITQPIENSGKLCGKTVTFSAIVKGYCRLGCNDGLNGIMTFPAYATYADWTLISLTFTFPNSVTTYFSPLIQTNNKGEFECKCAKLEYGTISTLENDCPPEYSTEVFKCIHSKADSTDTYSNGAAILSATKTTSTNGATTTFPVAKSKCDEYSLITIEGYIGTTSAWNTRFVATFRFAADPSFAIPIATTQGIYSMLLNVPSDSPTFAIAGQTCNITRVIGIY